MFCRTMPMQLAGDPDRLGNLQRVVVHQDHVGRFNGCVEPIAPMAMPMSARLSTGASLMPSPTNASFSRRALLRQQLLDLIHLVAGQQLAVHLVDAKLRGDLIRHSLTVARQHNGLGNAGLFQRGDGLPECGLTTSEITI